MDTSIGRANSHLLMSLGTYQQVRVIYRLQLPHWHEEILHQFTIQLLQVVFFFQLLKLSVIGDTAKILVLLKHFILAQLRNSTKLKATTSTWYKRGGYTTLGFHSITYQQHTYHAYMHHHLVLFAFEFSKVGNLIPLENYLRKYQKGHIMLHIIFLICYGFICSILNLG